MQQQQNEYSFKVHRGTFSRIDYIIGHKSNFSKFKEIEIISTIFDHNSIKLEYSITEKDNRKDLQTLENKTTHFEITFGAKRNSKEEM